MTSSHYQSTVCSGRFPVFLFLSSTHLVSHEFFQIKSVSLHSCKDMWVICVRPSVFSRWESQGETATWLNVLTGSQLAKYTQSLLFQCDSWRIRYVIRRYQKMLMLPQLQNLLFCQSTFHILSLRYDLFSQLKL